MKKFEYKRYYASNNYDNRIEADLAQLGQEGWEAVSMAQSGKQTEIILFKRELPVEMEWAVTPQEIAEAEKVTKPRSPLMMETTEHAENELPRASEQTKRVTNAVVRDYEKVMDEE